ncbi:MAG: DUF5719 family protein [Candidatus Woesearchaeota archaeon]
MDKQYFPFVLGLVLFASLVSAQDAGFTQYFAGCHVSEESDCFLHVLNPFDHPVDAQITVYHEKDGPVSFTAAIGAHSTFSLDLSDKASGALGIKVESDDILVVDGVQYDDTRSAGFGDLAVPEPSFNWYAANGYSSGTVKTFLYILNPASRESSVTVTLYYDNGEKKTFQLQAPAERVLRVDLKERTQPEKRFGVKVTSTAPVVVSSATFDKSLSGAYGGHATTVVEKGWLFPGGKVSDKDGAFLDVLNPSLGVAHLTITIYYDDGSTTEVDETVPAKSKRHLVLSSYTLESEEFSIAVDSDVDVAATVFFASDESGFGGSGASGPSADAYFAYGIVNTLYDTYLSVFNPSGEEADLKITFYYDDGSVKSSGFKAPSMMRSTVELDAIEGKPFGLSVESSAPVVVSQVVHDKKRSASYSYIGASGITPDYEEGLPMITGAVVAEPAPTSLILIKEENIANSRFKDSMQEGLVSVTKSSYLHDESDSIAWRFVYSDDKSAASAAGTALAGGILTAIEITPATVSGTDMQKFISTKSEGFLWLNGAEVYVFIAAKGDIDVAQGLAELRVAEVPVSDTAEKRSISQILIYILALIIVVFIVRRVFRSSEDLDDEDDDAVWSDDIDSAKPKTKKQKSSDIKKKTAKKKVKKKHTPEPKKETPVTVKKEDHKKEIQKHEKKQKISKEEPKPAVNTPSHDKKTQTSHDKKPKISIREIPRDQLTAQDILDNLEDIPDYEDVFKHVNRDNEVIKPK